MKIFQVYDRLSPRHKWNLVVNVQHPEYAARVKARTMAQWWNYSNPKALAAQVAEREIEVEEYQSGEDSLAASVRLDNVWCKNQINANDVMIAALMALSPVATVPVDDRPIGQRA